MDFVLYNIPRYHCFCKARSVTTAVQPGSRSDIAPLSASFAEETRQARTHVRNWSGDDCKARGSKQDRSVSRRGEVGATAGKVDAVQSQIDVVADFAVGLGIFFI